MGNRRVRELIQLYEDIIAAETKKTRVTYPLKLQKFQAAIVHYAHVVESAPGEPHCGVLKVIDAVEISTHVPYDAVAIVRETDKTFKKEYMPESQSIGELERIHVADSGCFEQVIHWLTHLVTLHRRKKPRNVDSPLDNCTFPNSETGSSLDTSNI